MEEDPPPEDLPLAEVGRFARISQAREYGLVLSAMNLPHWILRDGPWFTVCVEEQSRDLAVRELAAFDSERLDRAEAFPEPAEKPDTLSLYVFAWLMGAFWFAQNSLPQGWSEQGTAVSRKIFQDGEWWRVLTALTLHGDLSHLVANLVTGLLFATFAIRQLGPGLSWLAIVCSGALGNALNAWFYRHEDHLSIGASTAVFGALGLLVGGEFAARLRSPHTRGRWQLILPIGAGFALLAFLGVGDEHKHIDYMAHFWGLLAGIVVGAIATVLKLKERASRVVQWAAAFAALGLLALAWWRALRGR